MGRLIVLLAIGVALWWLLHWFRNTPPQQVAAVLRKSLVWVAVGLLLLAVLSGRLNPLFAALAAAVPVVFRALNLLQALPALHRMLQSLGLVGPGPVGGGQSGGGQQSSIRTRYLDMSLDHETGAMDGEVLEGPFAGQQLSELTLPQLLRMLELYQESDARSAAVLTAYLDREHPDWREDAAAAGASGAGQGSGGTGQAAARGMTKDDAWSILGLEPGAEPDAVRAAHRRLMQRLHPDRGGSDYLAAQINAAKDLLLEE
ncbi:molecular chaperone DnaJ [Thiohalocapsa halophila]|uniref:Molecular chaperone DnaJ n=1 Tax=Thiohalocapsa halophila TaxID=69359 RepID=A0ABS1CH38_9GAMM|nr:molecular chaperone DnaJ [Thiohalocapsa halophila]MBK1631236.1 molecular chaperone DnaJ [Thiohalocapsa halophila]